MNRVAVLTSHLTTGDAVSNDVVGMYRAFEGRGLEARIFAGGCDFTEPEFFPFTEIPDFITDSSDLLIYHYSIGWEPGLDLLHRTKGRTAIKYHNITPPEFFAGISPWHEEKCRQGREELRDVALADCDIYLADSEYNRRDLLLEGVSESKCFVVPPFHHIDRLHQIEPDMKVLDKYRDGATNILMVGRVAPHKGHPALIKAFAAYHYDYNRRSRLIIVGKEEKAFKTYSQRLRGLAAQTLSDEAVFFIGGASDHALKAYYLLASVFTIASQHEGFCVPLVEAMSMKVPVVAHASSAVPATVSDAGLVLKESQPYFMAEAIDRLVRDESLNFAFGLAGWRRYEEHFTNQKIGRELFRALSRLE